MPNLADKNLDREPGVGIFSFRGGCWRGRGCHVGHKVWLRRRGCVIVREVHENRRSAEEGRNREGRRPRRRAILEIWEIPEIRKIRKIRATDVSVERPQFFRDSDDLSSAFWIKSYPRRGHRDFWEKRYWSPCILHQNAQKKTTRLTWAWSFPWEINEFYDWNTCSTIRRKKYTERRWIDTQDMMYYIYCHN